MASLSRVRGGHEAQSSCMRSSGLLSATFFAARDRRSISHAPVSLSRRDSFVISSTQHCRLRRIQAGSPLGWIAMVSSLSVTIDLVVVHLGRGPMRLYTVASFRRTGDIEVSPLRMDWPHWVRSYRFDPSTPHVEAAAERRRFVSWGRQIARQTPSWPNASSFLNHHQLHYHSAHLCGLLIRLVDCSHMVSQSSMQVKVVVGNGLRFPGSLNMRHEQIVQSKWKVIH